MIVMLKFKQTSLYALGVLKLNSYYFPDFYNFIIINAHLQIQKKNMKSNKAVSDMISTE